MTVVQIVDVTVVLHGGVSAAEAVDMLMSLMNCMFGHSVHSSKLATIGASLA